MEMQQVRYFVALCETLNFTRAAERSNVSQPSLTRAIKLLEDELGGPLFNRERNKTHLTELGRLMEPHLREALLQTRAAKHRASAFFELRSARLRLGVTRGLPLLLLDEALSRYSLSYPETEIEVMDERASALRDALRGGELEVVVLPQRAHDIDDLHYYPVGEDRLVAVLPEGHHLAGREALPLGDLAAEPLVCGSGCLFFEAAERHLAELGVRVRPKAVAGSVEWLQHLVLTGVGVGLTSAGQALRPGLVDRPVVAPPLAREVSMATKRGRLYSPPVRAFVEIALRPRGGPQVAASAA